THYAITNNSWVFMTTIVLLNKMNKNHTQDIPKLDLSKSIYRYNKSIKYDNYNLESECLDDIYLNQNIKLDLEINSPTLDLKGIELDINSDKFKTLDNKTLTKKFFKKFKAYSNFMENNQIKRITFKDYKSKIAQTLNSKKLDNTFTSEELELLETIIPNKVIKLLDEVEHQINHTNKSIVYPGYKSISQK